MRAILWGSRTDAPWRKTRVLNRVLDPVQTEADASGKLDWTLH
ncbi:MAG TPA: hypothetical protein VEY95_07015 [Azospirillaceae bacterium]|nr:hypothetical protein [Azospirillaceae bacterium]